MVTNRGVPVLVALLLGLSGCAGALHSTEAQAASYAPAGGVGSTYFYDQLAPYGRWIDDPPYGWCWTPYDQPPDWRPYTDGCWDYTDYGWTWTSYEPWGWAPFHYGRWLFDPVYGWVWVPGENWAPAWVAWRFDADWIGWAPLPPAADWSPATGLDEHDLGRIPHHAWSFVRFGRLLDRNLRPDLASVARNATLFGRTRDATRFVTREGHVADRGVDRAVVERATGLRIPLLRLVDAPRPSTGHGRRPARGALAMFRPAVHGDLGLSSPPVAVRRRPAPPARSVERQRQAARRRLEATLARDRARLERRQRAEMHGVHRQARVERLQRRQRAERAAFKRHAARQRQVFRGRWDRGVAAPGRGGGHGGGRGRGRR